MLSRFGSLRGLDAAQAEALRDIPGLGPAKIAQIIAVLGECLYFQRLSPTIAEFLPNFCRNAAFCSREERSSRPLAFRGRSPQCQSNTPFGCYSPGNFMTV